jgi:cell division protein FtsL
VIIDISKTNSTFTGRASCALAKVATKHITIQNRLFIILLACSVIAANAVRKVHYVVR